MPIPPINPSTTYTASRVKYTLSPAEFSTVTTLPGGYEQKVDNIDTALPVLNGRLAAETDLEAAVNATFFGIGVYLGGLEIEIEGLIGRLVVPVTAGDVSTAEAYNGGLPYPRLFPAAQSGADVESMGPTRIADLFGGVFLAFAFRPDNEQDGITTELPLLALAAPTPADNTAWQAALVREDNGLTKQTTGLTTIAATPWSVDVTAELAAVVAAQADVVVHQGLNLTTMTLAQKAARTATITARSLAITARAGVNTTARTAEYEFRFQILDSLVNRLHGLGRLKEATAKNIALITEQRDFFSNFDTIYSAVGS